ncbi:MAG: ABC transporter permease, partial [Spirochaetaceae bacterium]
VTRLLSEHYPTFPVITDRETLSAESSLRRSERHYGVVTLAAQLAEINDLLFAMTAIAGVIIIMFLAITMIGVANTYTMITFERTREIGTLRALGMQARDAVFVFVAEAVTLSLAGLALGMVVGVGILAIVSSQLSYAPGGVTDLFLRGGRLIWQLPAGGLGAIAVLTVSAGTLGAMRASVRAGRTSPVDALRR